LLTAAALVGRSLQRLLAVDTGLSTERVVATELTVPAGLYPDADAAREVVARLARTVSELPEVEAAGAVTSLPFIESIGDLGVAIAGRELPGDGNLEVDWQATTPGYAEAVGLRLLQGRWIEERDRPESVGSVVINRTFASRYWPNGDAVGATVRLSAGASPEEARVVGVVEDVKHEGPAAPAQLQIYIPHRQFLLWHGNGPARAVALVVRARPGVEGVPAAVRRAVREVDPRLGLGAFVELARGYRDTLSRPRLLAAVFGAFAAIAALLAVVGVYGVMAYAVAQRRREIGIRRALGARPGNVGRQVLAEVLALGGWGVGLGVALSLLHARSLESALFGVSTLDLSSLLGAAALVLLAALAAGMVPLVRALRVHPAEALRSE
jgi:predicted permease